MKATFKTFRITSTYLGTKKWDVQGVDNWNNHRITIYNSITKKRASFNFWASIANPELRTRYDLLNAFYCILNDANAGRESFDDFCSNFGYDNDSRKAEKTHKACIAIDNKLASVIGSLDIYELLYELSEVAA